MRFPANWNKIKAILPILLACFPFIEVFCCFKDFVVRNAFSSEWKNKKNNPIEHLSEELKKITFLLTQTLNEFECLNTNLTKQTMLELLSSKQQYKPMIRNKWAKKIGRIAFILFQFAGKRIYELSWNLQKNAMSNELSQWMMLTPMTFCWENAQFATRILCFFFWKKQKQTSFEEFFPE